MITKQEINIMLLENYDQAIDMICQVINESEKSKQLLRKKGYGYTGMSLFETIRLEIPEKNDL